MIVAVLQARTSSTRLPGKVVMPLCGEPMLARQIERIGRSQLIDRLIVATSDRPEDDIVAEVAERAGAASFRGSLDDVLDRFHSAVAGIGATHIVRLTADCPLTDWRLIDRCIDFARSGGFDYASNTLRATWPDGLDVEVMTANALDTAWRGASDPAQREHVTMHLYANRDRFRLGSLENDRDLSNLRWTVDEPQDYEFARAVYDRLYPANAAFTTEDILALLDDEPAIAELNLGVGRRSSTTSTDGAFE